MPENEVRKLQALGFYRKVDIDFGDDATTSSDVKEEIEKFADKTGLKKLGKKLAPLAPIAAQFIPGGPIVSGAVGAGLQGLLGGQKPKDYLADAAMGAGIGALAQGATRGFTKEGMSIFDPNFVGPADPSKLGGGAPLRQSVGMDIIKGLQSGGIKGALGNLVDEGTLAGGLLGIGGRRCDRH